MSGYSDLYIAQVIMILCSLGNVDFTMAIKELCARQTKTCCRNEIEIETNQSVASEPGPPMMARSVKSSQTPEKAVQGLGHI